MAKVVKDTRDVMDIEDELKKVKSNKKSSDKKEKDKEAKQKKASKKSTKKTKKHSKIVTFFKEVKVEVSKVKWPSKKDMIKYSLATIMFVVFFALFFYAIDAVIALLKEVI